MSYASFFEAHVGKFRLNTSGQASGLCPFHDDHGPSLSIDTNEGLWKCHGCNQSGNANQFANLLEVTPPTNGHDYRHREVAQYIYEDKNGRPYHQVRRYFPKTFLQFRFENGEWKPGLDGSKTILYHLPEILKANVIFIAEGEKDCETLRKWELIVTCNPMGAGKWRDEFSDVLAGKSVIILPDDDEPGRAHANSVAESLWGKAKRVKIVHLPGAKDVSEWVEKGGTFEALLDMAEKTPALSETDVRAFETPQIKISDETVWEEPILLSETQTPEVPASTLPSWLGEYVEAVSKSTQTPSGMAVMMGLSNVAACVQKRFEVCPFGDSYTEPLNLWTATALPPASKKTAVTSLLTDPLSEWEREQTNRLKSKISEIETARAVNQKRCQQLETTAAKTEDPQERAMLVQEIAQIKQETPEEIRSPRLWTGDVTPERLQNLLAEHGERMSLLSDEGGIFEVLSGLYSDGKVNMDVFLQGHAGKSVRVDRGNRTVYLNKPALTFGLTVQPEIIRELSRGDKKRFRGNGTLARFLYCLPKSNIGQRDVTQRISIPEKLRDKYQAEIKNLLDIPPSLDENGLEQPRLLLLDDEALRSWLAFSQYIESNQGEGKEFEPIQDWTGKLPGASLRIAGICHLVEFGASKTVINKTTMERTLDLAELLIKHAQAAFETMGDDPSLDDAKTILKWILKERRGSFKQNECHKALRSRFRKVERLLKALSLLADHNIISRPERFETKKPSTVYRVNPAIFGEDNHGVA